MLLPVETQLEVAASPKQQQRLLRPTRKETALHAQEQPQLLLARLPRFEPRGRRGVASPGCSSMLLLRRGVSFRVAWLG